VRGNVAMLRISFSFVELTAFSACPNRCSGRLQWVDASLQWPIV